MSNLDSQLLAAHARGDKAALVGLYRQAAEQSSDPDEAAFFVTQAYIFALDTNDSQLDQLRAWLVRAGRERPDQ